MKNYKIVCLLFALIFAGNAKALAQSFELVNANTMQVNDSTFIKVGDTISANLPISKDFTFITPAKKGFGLSKLSKIGNIGSSLGSALGTVGGATGSLGTLNTGIDVMNAGNVASSIGNTAEAVNQLDVSKDAKSLIGKKLVVISFEKDPDNNEVIALTKLLDGKKQYKVGVLQAVLTKEVVVN